MRNRKPNSNQNRNRRTSRNARQPQRTIQTRTVPAAYATNQISASFTQRPINGGRGNSTAGTEYLGPIGTDANGDGFYNWSVNPLHWYATRVYQVARLYERWVLNKCVLHFVPNVSTMSAGTVTLAFDADAGDVPIYSMAGLFAQGDATQFSIYQTGSLQYKSNMKDKLFCDVDSSVQGPRFTSAGRAYCYVDTDEADTTVGRVWLEYDITFYVPDYPSSVEQRGIGEGIGKTLTTVAGADDEKVTVTMAGTTLQTGDDFMFRPTETVSLTDPIHGGFQNAYEGMPLYGHCYDEDSQQSWIAATIDALRSQRFLQWDGAAAGADTIVGTLQSLGHIPHL